jgi:hypothetical protein
VAHSPERREDVLNGPLSYYDDDYYYYDYYHFSFKTRARANVASFLGKFKGEYFRPLPGSVGN